MKTPHRHSMLAGLLLSFMLLGLNAHAVVIYSFEGLSNGTLDGQDNWTSPSGAPFIVSDGTGYDTSKVTGTAGSATSNFAIRANDGNFSFGSLVGVTTLTLGFDTRYVAGGNAGTNNQSQFSLNSADSVTGSAAFGLNGNGLVINSSGPVLPSGLNFDDWFSLQLVMDLTANSGDGSGSLFYKNLTDGDTGYTAVAGLQDINLDLSPLQDPTQWTRMVLRTGFYEGNKIDNLYIASVPEPSCALLTALGLICLIPRRRR